MGTDSYADLFSEVQSYIEERRRNEGALVGAAAGVQFACGVLRSLADVLEAEVAYPLEEAEVRLRVVHGPRWWEDLDRALTLPAPGVPPGREHDPAGGAR